MPRLALTLLAALWFAACGGSAGERPGAEASPDPALPAGVPEECANALPTTVGDPVPGLMAVPDVVLGPSAPRGPNIQVTGFLPQTPLEFLESVRRQRKWKVLFKEDEVSEAEVLVSDGRNRNFWKVVQACPTGSRVVVLVADESRT